MTMPSSGPLNMGGTSSPVSVAQELGLSLTAQISMNDAAVRTLAGAGGSGTQWSMSSLYGKSNRAILSYVYSANTANASLNVSTISGYVAGKSDITVTVNSGIYVYSTSTGTPGLTLSGSTTGDTVTLVNNGYIMGMGGAGGYADPSTYGRVGGGGGTALSLSISCSITNNSYIGGGGGGGASSAGNGNAGASGGGGAGGGAGGDANLGGWGYYYGGAGGGAGASGSNGSYGGPYPGSKGGYYYTGGSAGGGGRIMPGSGGTCGSYGLAGGGGGAGGGGTSSTGGATGGSAGNAGGTTYQYYVGIGSGGGGGWGASGGGSQFQYYGTYSGGAGGKCVALNGNTVTWNTVGTRYGAIS